MAHSPYKQVQFKKQMLPSSVELIKKKMFMIHINVSIMQTVTLANETVV